MDQALVIVSGVFAVIALGFASAWIGRRLWTRRTKRLLVLLVGHKEGLASAVRSLREWTANLLASDDTVWEAFVNDVDSVERRSLGEIAHRADVVAVELAGTPLPRALHGLADHMEALAATVRERATAIDAGRSPDEVLMATEAMDLPAIVREMEQLERATLRLQESFGVTDPAVYGGGLYI